VVSNIQEQVVVPDKEAIRTILRFSKDKYPLSNILYHMTYPDLQSVQVKLTRLIANRVLNPLNLWHI
jgi:hypothetical protein